MPDSLVNWFNPLKAVRIYRGNLPHWRQSGCLYFITFRLGDAVPRSVSMGWQEERRQWMAAHGIEDYPKNPVWRERFEKLPEHERRKYMRMNAHRLFDELDRGGGACLLRQPTAQETVRDAMLFFDGERGRVGDFVIMPNHVHALVQPLGSWELESVLTSVKQFSARRINADLHRSGTVWQKEYYDHIVRDRSELFRIREYIERNPGKAGLRKSDALYYRADWLDHELGS